MTTLATKRPASTGGSAGITLFGGAGTLHATLADTNNATYAQCAPGGLGKIIFQTQTIPTGAVVQSIVLRVTARRVADGTKLNATLNGHTPTQFHPPTGSGWGTLSSTSYAAALTKPDLAAGVSMVWLVGPGNVDISEAFLDITYIPIPTVNVTAPTGTVSVTRPIVTWDVTGDYPQERFHIKVFSSAQFSGAGFQADASTAFYDSGEQIGAIDTYVPTVNLANGDTYRFYVQVAQKVGSTTQWSAWDFTTATVSAVPPAIPTIAVLADDTQARIKITIADTSISGSSLYGAGTYGSGIYGAADTSAWQFVTVERTADGTTWTTVRGANRAPVTGSTLYDYESGNGQPVQYRARAIGVFGESDVASDWSSPTALVSWSSTQAWLKSLTRPTLNTAIVINDIPTVTRRIPRGVLDVAGRRDPIVVSDTRKFLEGTVTFVTLEDSDLDVLQALLDTSETLLLQTPSTWGFGSRYISCGDEEEQRTSPSALETSRLVVVPFNEVASPVGDIIGFGITWADVIARYLTWDDVIAANVSWAALLNA